MEDPKLHRKNYMTCIVVLTEFSGCFVAHGAKLDSSCEKVLQTFCDVYHIDNPECCLSACMDEILALSTCSVASLETCAVHTNCLATAPPATVSIVTSPPTTLNSEPVMVNSSFLVSTTQGLKADQLNADLNSGVVSVLKQAYLLFTQKPLKE